jgi:hypothetical protein
MPDNMPEIAARNAGMLPAQTTRKKVGKLEALVF